MAKDFWKVECNECGNQQIIFSRSATEIECLVCGEVVASPKGGKPEVNGEVTEVLKAE